MTTSLGRSGLEDLKLNADRTSKSRVHIDPGKLWEAMEFKIQIL